MKYLFGIILSVFACQAYAAEFTKQECRDLKHEIRAIFQEAKQACKALPREEQRECKEEARDDYNQALDDLKEVCSK